MKKVLSVLGLIAILSMSTPAFAAPGGHGGPKGHGPGGHRIHAGAHHRYHIAPRHHHGGVTIHTGYSRSTCWGQPWCDYRLGYCDSYYYPSPRVYVPMGGASFSIRF